MGFSLRTWLMLAVISVPAIIACEVRADVVPTNSVIGLLVPPEESNGVSLREGATLAVELANQSAPPRWQLVVRGRAGQWGADGVEAARMVTDDGAIGLIAPPDGAATHLVLQVSGRTAVPVITLSADSSVTRAGVPWALRIVPGAMDQANILLKHDAIARWNIVVPDGRSGREASHDLSTAASAVGCAIAQTNVLAGGNPNLTQLARAILSNQPDAILLWLDATNASALIRTVRGAGFAGTLAGPAWLDSGGFVSLAGEAANGLKIAEPVLDPPAQMAYDKFSGEFQRRFGNAPDAVARAGFDAANLLMQILRSAGNRPVNELFPVKAGFVGASGRMCFDAQGNRQSELHVVVLQNGKFSPIKPNQNQ